MENVTKLTIFDNFTHFRDLIVTLENKTILNTKSDALISKIQVTLPFFSSLWRRLDLFFLSMCSSPIPHTLDNYKSNPIWMDARWELEILNLISYESHATIRTTRPTIINTPLFLSSNTILDKKYNPIFSFQCLVQQKIVNQLQTFSCSKEIYIEIIENILFI